MAGVCFVPGTAITVQSRRWGASSAGLSKRHPSVPPRARTQRLARLQAVAGGSSSGDPAALLNPELYTEKAYAALARLSGLATRYGQSSIESELLLYGLLDDELATRIVEKAAAGSGAVDRLKRKAVDFIQRQPRVSSSSQQVMGRSLKEALETAVKEKESMEDSFVSVEHLLVACWKDGRLQRGLLDDSTFSLSDLEKTVKEVRGGQKVTTQSPEATYEALLKYGRDLTDEARSGKLDPVIGRDDEIRRAIQILSRRTKNNPVLIGEPGVGKTAIAEGLAQRILSGDVPASLQGRRLIGLDLGSLVAGAKFRGEFEERLKAVLKEVKEAEGGIVLFIDELHTVIGTGKSDGAMDAGNLLKPMLARGELSCIGATTLDEYRKYIEKDAALERRFQQVVVDQPNVPDTISILRGLKERYEVHHGVRITDSALVAAAMLSNRYIADRFLPDKAIDLVDESMAKLKMEITSKPQALDSIDRKIVQLEMERLSLKNEQGEASRSRLRSIVNELETLKQEQTTLEMQWEGERGALDDVQELKEEMDRVNREIERAEQTYDLNKAAELKYSTLVKLQEKLDIKEGVLEQQNATQLLRDQVTEDDIASTVSTWTRIPINKLLATEKEKLLGLEDEITKRVVGQEDAVKAVAEAVQRSRAGLANPRRPIASFAFLGPTGVGKTELAKALAQQMFDDESAMIRLDMSEYGEKFNVSRLVGAPPGYVGYEEGGQLSEPVRRRPYSVILFDEIEKAHPDVFNMLLQVLDDGRLTDSQGRTVDFTNTVCILTSNIGSETILDLSKDESRYEEMRVRVLDAMRRSFRPEFLNRLDEFIIFHALSKAGLRKIVDLNIAELNGRLHEKQLSINVSEEAASFIADVGFDPAFGARPLRRAVQRELETPIAQGILSNKYMPGDVVSVEVVNERLGMTSIKGGQKVVNVEDAEVPPEQGNRIPAL